MSLAPASSRGAFLKARLAVNGIQCAARSLGTLTAAGRGLLSSMVASCVFGCDGCPQGISFAPSREPTTPRACRNSAGRSQRTQGNVQRVDKAGGLVGQPG